MHDNLVGPAHPVHRGFLGLGAGAESSREPSLARRQDPSWWQSPPTVRLTTGLGLQLLSGKNVVQPALTPSNLTGALPASLSGCVLTLLSFKAGHQRCNSSPPAVPVCTHLASPSIAPLFTDIISDLDCLGTWWLPCLCPMRHTPDAAVSEVGTRWVDPREGR